MKASRNPISPPARRSKSPANAAVTAPRHDTDFADWAWTIGIVVAPFGLRGEMKVRMETDFPERFGRLKKVCLRLKGRPPETLFIQQARLHKGQVLLKAEGIDSIEDAETWRGALVQIKRDDAVPLEEGNYYIADLIGLDVVTADGKSLGKLDEVLTYPAQDLLRIGDILIPAVKEFVVQVDLARGKIVVSPPEGLLPGEQAVSDAD